MQCVWRGSRSRCNNTVRAPTSDNHSVARVNGDCTPHKAIKDIGEAYLAVSLIALWGYTVGSGVRSFLKVLEERWDKNEALSISHFCLVIH